MVPWDPRKGAGGTPHWVLWVAGAGWVWSVIGLGLYLHLYAVSLTYGLAPTVAHVGVGIAGAFFALATICTVLGVAAWRQR